MITLSLNFDSLLGGTAHKSHEKKIREIIDTHLAFPGSDKLKMDLNIKNNGASSISFTGPQDALSEARRLWKENVKPAADKAAAQMKKAAAKANQAMKKAVQKKRPAKVKAAKRPLARAKAKVTKSAKIVKKAVKKTVRKKR